MFKKVGCIASDSSTVEKQRLKIQNFQCFGVSTDFLHRKRHGGLQVFQVFYEFCRLSQYDHAHF
jgi:hypothetical protein